MTTITTSQMEMRLFRRGDLVQCMGERFRVLRASHSTLTMRHCHRFPFVEALRYAFERFVWWPMTDLFAPEPTP